MVRRPALLAALVLIAVTAALPAAGSTLDVHADYLDNGVIDQPHSQADLRDALEAAQGDVQYAGLAAAISDALEHDLLGRSPDQAAAPGAPAADDADGLGVLPRPRAIEDTGAPPWPLMVLALIGGLLVMSGAGSSIYRRAHRPD
jgi:hypothetical protein